VKGTVKNCAGTSTPETTSPEHTSTGEGKEWPSENGSTDSGKSANQKKEKAFAESLTTVPKN